MTLSNFGLSVENLTALILLYSLLFLVIAVIGAVLFFLKGFGIYKMSRALKIKRSWYGFVPFLNIFAFGRLADATNRKQTNNRALITAVYILKTLLAFIFAVLFVIALVELLFAADKAVFNGEKLDSDVFYVFKTTFFVLCATFIFKIIYAIITAVYAAKIYKLFGVRTANLNAVLGFIFPVLLPFFVYAVSKNDPHEQKSGLKVDGAVFSIDG